MAKILKQGNKLPEVARYTCGGCGSRVEFERNDVKSSIHDNESWVRCPSCSDVIDAKDLKWIPASQVKKA